MSRATITFLSALAGAMLGLAAAWGLADAHGARAQARRAPADADVAIAPGPGGMYIVRGNTLVVCVAGARPAGIQPFQPECGEPVLLD
ncbi:MAG TPA: hypothetical protein VIL20_31030 [Sandaracinaceae bacterium]